MGEIKPIETYYNGYRFRSRLEARWAVFFDAMGIKYEYEPEGFEFDNHEKYLPDFFLLDFGMFVEIKNSSAFAFAFDGDYVYANDGTESGDKYVRFANEITKNGNTYLVTFGDPLDAFISEEHGGKGDNMLFYREECAVHSVVAIAAKHNPEMEFISDHGNCKQCNTFLRDMGACKAVMLTQDFIFTPPAGSRERHTVPHIKKFVPVTSSGEIDDGWEEFFYQCNVVLNDYVPKFIRAVKQARQARFEHGETPNI